MARVAEATCETCHHIRPRTDMRKVSVNRKVGTRFGISHSRRNTRESASVQFRRQDVWVCRGCKPPRSDGLIPWKTAAVLALGIGGFAWFADASTKRQVASGVGTLVTTAGNELNPATQGRKAVSALPGMASEDDAAAPDPEDFDWTRDAIAKARSKALDGKGAKSWKADGIRGQAVASAATVTDGTECRNVYATAKVEGRGIKSPVTTWCRTDDGPWSIRG